MNFISKEPINKGWSGEKKYAATGEDGKRYLLRISDISTLDEKKLEFDMMKRVAELGISMCLPIEFGVCDEGVYSLQSFIDGRDAEEAIGEYSEREQYEFGLEAGRILRKIHSIPAPDIKEAWDIYFNKKIDNKIKNYRECPLKYENDEPFFRYIKENRHLLCDREWVYQHGDYHIGNMMIDKNGRLVIIDFHRCDFGDPWEEFRRIVWSAGASHSFASGTVDGYFDFNVPLEFWKMLALYISSSMFASLYWAISFGEDEIETMRNQAKEVLYWYDNLTDVVPRWYKEKGR